MPNYRLPSPTVFHDKHIWPTVAIVTGSMVIREAIMWVSHFDMLRQQLFQQVFGAIAAVGKVSSAVPLHSAGVLATELSARINTWLDYPRAIYVKAHVQAMSQIRLAGV